MCQYASDKVRADFGTVSDAALEKIKSLPCLIAEELCNGECEGARIGFITNVSRPTTPGTGLYTVHFKVVADYPLIPRATLQDLFSMLAVTAPSTSRWAVMENDLNEALVALGFPPLPRDPRKFNILTHKFRIALSFARDDRPQVKEIADELKERLGKNEIFYDKYYQPLLAANNIDNDLARIYRTAELVVVFLSREYEQRVWTRHEDRAIRDAILHQPRGQMYLLTEDYTPGIIPGNTGHMSIVGMDTEEIADAIMMRLDHDA